MVPLGPLVFCVGAATLGAEIAGARLLAPYFGSSTFVWANTIGVVLLALSLGYWWGGSLASRHPHMRGLCRLVLAGAALMAAAPFVARPFLSVSVDALSSLSAGAFAGSLLGVLVLVGAPVLVLGAVSPWAIQLTIADLAQAGRATGRLYAVSTAGALVGTLLTAVLLIPAIGTQRTFIAFAALIALLAAPGAALRPAAPALAAAIVAALAIPPGTIKGIERPGRTVIHERETEYQYVRVIERADGTRRLELNEGRGVHSLFRPETVLTDGVWDGYLVLPLAVLERPPRSVAILGNAGGTTARAYAEHFSATRIDAVEIDGELTDVARRYFGLRERSQLNVIEADARPFLRRTAHRYDAIFADAYRQPYIPFYLATREFFELARDRLAPGGVLVVNAAHPDGDERLEEALTATMSTAFEHVWRTPVEDENTLLVATNARAPSAARMLAATTDHAPEVRSLAARVSGLLEPGLPGGPVWTDDRAPVEWLIDRSIVEYAAEGGG